MMKIKIDTQQGSYPVFLGRGLLESGGGMLARCRTPAPVLLVTDRNVSPHYAGICRRGLLRAGFKPYTVILEGGEKEKSLQTAERLYNYALREGLDRKSLVMALGGGVIGDLAGFVASTYMRGIPFIQVPTTLLAMVDSSVGGKVAVNHPGGKNLIGTFYQPAMVLADLQTLKTLPPREYMAGFAELVKYGIILDETLFEQLERFARLQEEQQHAGTESVFLHLDSLRLLKYIAKAVILKGKIVSLDERETGLRRILNFGHTFAHALEQATAYEYFLHGEAVAVGMMAATRLASTLKMLDEKTSGRILNLLSKLISPPPPGGLDSRTVVNALLSDKKKEGRELMFILPVAIGKAVVCKSPPMEEVERVIEQYLTSAGKRSKDEDTNRSKWVKR